MFIQSKIYLQLVPRFGAFKKKIIICELLSNIVSGIDQWELKVLKLFKVKSSGSFANLLWQIL